MLAGTTTVSGGANWSGSQRNRFDDTGIVGLLDLIRDAGMVPGLWLELRPWAWLPFGERMATRMFYPPMVVQQSLVVVVGHHPTVRAHADEVIDVVGTGCRLY